jgi:mono/diheme cytochrome c family protein
MGLIGSIFIFVLGLGCNSVEKASKPSMEPEMKAVETAGLCPQTRGTVPAPGPYAGMTNPLPASNENISGGKLLFHEDARPIPCEICHGFKGNGFGVIFQRMQPYPRDFTCYNTMKDVSDGQLFWIIKNGSHGTRMKAFEKLEDEQIWQLVHYIRHFAD